MTGSERDRIEILLKETLGIQRPDRFFSIKNTEREAYGCSLAFAVEADRSTTPGDS